MWDLSLPTKDETHPLELKIQNLNHWTTREVPVPDPLKLASYVSFQGGLRRYFEIPMWFCLSFSSSSPSPSSSAEGALLKPLLLLTKEQELSHETPSPHTVPKLRNTHTQTPLSPEGPPRPPRSPS